VQIDRLRADDNHRIALLAQSLQCIQQDTAGDDVLRIKRARLPRARPSTP
jgi:hypothetical protein